MVVNGGGWGWRVAGWWAGEVWVVGVGSWRLIIEAAAAAALHLDIIEEECGFALDNGLKEGTSAFAGGRALWFRRRS